MNSTQTQHNHSSREEESIPDTLRTITPEAAARAALNGVACHLGRDDVRLLTRIAELLRAQAREVTR